MHVIGFFANVILIASFLGLGVGMMRAKESPAESAAFRMVILVTVLAVYRSIDPSVGLNADSAYGINEVVFVRSVTLPLPLILIGLFSLVAWTLIPFGRLIAVHFDRYDRIPAYTIDISGSLVGVLAFTLVSAAGLPSALWFIGIYALIALHIPLRSIVISVVTVLVALSVVYLVDSHGFDNAVLWSPYNQLRAQPVDGDLESGFIIDVNNQFLLTGVDLRPQTDGQVARTDYGDLATYYDFPFLLADPDSVLVLGAGAGNDVAAAQRAGVEKVTAVEIDPRVFQLGADHHPEQPYEDNVEVIIDDARSYLKSTDDTFDLVLFATLDAHGLISSSSSVRLDSFVYTKESLTEAKALLNDDGILVLSFGPFREEVQLRQYAMMEQVFGAPPAYFIHTYQHRMLVAGATDAQLTVLPTGWSPIERSEVLAGFDRYPAALNPATDDWPHLYVRDRSVPAEYVVSLVGMALIGLLMVRSQARAARTSDLPFFFLGAAFLLMETKSVTEFALLIGSTWQTNALVFSVILAIILLANVYVQRGGGANPRRWMVIIGLSLVAHFLWPISVWPDLGALELTAAAAYLGAPVFAAAVVFARWFSSSAVGSVALGVNLVGAVVGGALEYSSLIIGIRALAMVALVLYALAYVSYELVAARSPLQPTA